MKFSVQKNTFDIKVKVQFDVNGGDSISDTERTYVIGQTYESFPTATKSGQVPTGWYTDPVNGRKILTSDAVDYNVRKLYARYMTMTNYTSYEVTTTSSYKKFGIYSTTLKSGSTSQIIDWGDGQSEEVVGNISQVTHEYANSGTYTVKISDDISSIAISGNNSTWYQTTSQVYYTLKRILQYSTSLTSIPAYAYYYCYNMTSVSGISNSNITQLPTYCFYYCYNLSSLNGLSKITSIGTYCFYQCQNLTSFTGIGNITQLSDYSFWACSRITSLDTLPNSVTAYGLYCLGSTSVSNLSRIRTTDVLNPYCFGNMTSLTNLSTLSPRSSLPSACFRGCSGMTSVDLTNWTSLTSIPDYCFYNCSYLNSVKLPSTVTSIGTYAFAGIYYGQLIADFSNTQITALPQYCFYYTYSLKEVKLPNTLRRINLYAFYYCCNSYFTSIALPSALTSIGDYAFHYCQYLASISCYAQNAPTVYSNTFGNSTSYYTGRISYSAGTNRLYVDNPENYKTSYWNSVLLDSTKCGYSVQSMNPYDITYGRMEGLSSQYLSTGTAIVPDISVYSSNGTLLTENTDYSKQLSNNINVGTAGISAIGISPYTGCLAKTFEILGEAPTEYVKTGLVGMWDGENNAGEGQHSTSTKTWVNLGSGGSTYNATASSVAWGTNYSRLYASSSYRWSIPNNFLKNALGGEWTIEVVFKPTVWNSNYRGLFGNHSESNAMGLIFGQYGDGQISFNPYQQSNGLSPGMAPLAYSGFNTSSIYTLTMSGSSTNLQCRVFKNGTCLETKSTTAQCVTFTTTYACYIGAAYNAYGRDFSGPIYCVRCYNRALSDSEVLNNFNVDKNRFNIT